MTAQDAPLPRERNMIKVLVDGDLDGEVERVAAARSGALGAGGGLDAAAALARVLCLLHLANAVPALADVDHPPRFDLTLPRPDSPPPSPARHTPALQPQTL